jgi:hypothetical protein
VRTRVFTALFAVSLGNVYGQNQSPGRDSAEDIELTSLENTVRSAPPEFAADGLISLVASGRIKTSKEKVSILREAFQTAGRAQEPVAMRLVYPSGLYIPVQRSFAYGLDRVSLRVRAVKTLLRLDASVARQLFEQIAFELLPSASDCGQLYAYDLTSYYSLLQEMVNSSADPVEAQRLLASEIYKFTSIVQIRPLAQTIAGARLSQDVLVGLSFAYAQRFPN